MGKILYRQGIMILCSNLIPKFLPRYQRMRADKKSQSTIKAPLENLWVNMKLYPDFSTDQSSVKYCFEQN